MTEAGQSTHFLQHFFDAMPARAHLPLICEKQGSVYHTVTQREVAGRITEYARAFFALDIRPGDRVTLHAPAGQGLLAAEWAVLAGRAVAVIVPRIFGKEELAATLVESKSRVIVLERLSTAYYLAEQSASLPDLRYIVCLEGTAQAAIPILSWNDFIDSGRLEPDRSAAMRRTITAKDTALMFYFKNGATVSAMRHTHEALMAHSRRIENILGKQSLQKGELVLSAAAWEHPIGHIAACYLPVLKEAALQITHGTADSVLFENGPQVVVGNSIFFDSLRQNIVEHIRQSGALETHLLAKALSISKRSYESKKGLSFMKRAHHTFLKATIVKKVRVMLGGNARLFIGIDTDTHYDTELFFHTFGIELAELPEEAFSSAMEQ